MNQLYYCPHCGKCHAPVEWNQETKRRLTTAVIAPLNYTGGTGQFYFCPSCKSMVLTGELQTRLVGAVKPKIMSAAA